MELPINQCCEKLNRDGGTQSPLNQFVSDLVAQMLNQFSAAEQSEIIVQTQKRITDYYENQVNDSRQHYDTWVKMLNEFNGTK